MIETLYGRIFDLNATACTLIIECAGVGYHVTVTANTLSHLPSPKFAPDGTMVEGAPVRIFTHMAVREDAVELFGFHSREELEMFRLLISVSGVGPKAAMSILSLFTPNGLASAVAAGDVKSISRAPGVGAKTAARLALELKDKIAKNFPSLGGGYAEDTQIAPSGATLPSSNKLTDAQSALSALGYSRSEIAAAMKNVDLGGEVETIIKQALSALMKN
ncbi:MAG: Holliday junction branch migration protein RuvA [Ruminococcaceae bacterium]|nr:Holliday junction branch migration protein RuvA [Oscillospiraceae bacterium]